MWVLKSERNLFRKYISVMKSYSKTSEMSINFSISILLLLKMWYKEERAQLMRRANSE